LDGQSRPPLITDDVRWRRVVFENVHPPARREEIFQRGRFANAGDVNVYGMDDEPKPQGGAIAIVNICAGTMEWLTSRTSPNCFLMRSQLRASSLSMVF
jgi:hypothetical protein